MRRVGGCRRHQRLTVSTHRRGDPSANTGGPVTDPVSTCVAPGANATTVAGHVTGADPGANSGLTLAVSRSAPEHEIAVATAAWTVTFDRYNVPVFDTTNDTDNGEPAVTDTPGALTALQAETALGILEEHGWVQGMETDNTTGRPTTRYYINPQIRRATP